jgi:hypothetical protein
MAYEGDCSRRVAAKRGSIDFCRSLLNLSFSIVTLVFVILGLLEVDTLGRRLRRIGERQVGATAIDAATEIAARL